MYTHTLPADLTISSRSKLQHSLHNGVVTMPAVCTMVWSLCLLFAWPVTSNATHVTMHTPVPTCLLLQLVLLLHNHCMLVSAIL